MNDPNVLHAAADGVYENLKTTIDKIRIEEFGFNPRHAFSGRVKTAGNILEKVERKVRVKPDYTIANVTDVVGLRFVVLFKHDIPDIIETLFLLIAGKTADKFRGPNEFKNAEVREFIQYISLPAYMDGWRINGARDPLSESLNALLERYPKLPKLEIIPKINYSNVHIVLFVEATHNKTPVRIPVEIQLRTVFENAWGEVDHLLFFEHDRKSDGAGDDRRRAVSKHLSILKRLMDTATDYAAMIDSREDRKPSGERAPTIAIRNLDGAEYIREACIGRGLPGELTDALVGLIKRKEKLDQAPPSEIDYELRGTYVTIAREIRALIDRWDPDLKARPKWRDGLFPARMEEAIARLLSGQQDQIVRAVELYRSIAEDYPDYPTCWFRLGQACMRMTEDLVDDSERLTLVEDAITAYDQLRSTLAAIEPLDPDRRFLIISDHQRNLLLTKLPRLPSFALWMKSDLRRRVTKTVSAKDFEELRSAVDIGRADLDLLPEVERARLRSNLLYYLVDLAECARDTPSLGLPPPGDDEIRQALDGVIAPAEAAAEASACPPETWRLQHTLLHTYAFLGEDRIAIGRASGLLRTLGGLDKSQFPAEEAELAERAQAFATEVLFRSASRAIDDGATGRS